MKGFALSAEMADELVSMLAWWRAQPSGVRPVPRQPNKTATNVRRLRLTTTEPETLNGVVYNFAVVRDWNPDEGAWEDVSDDEVAVFGADSLIGEDGSGSGSEDEESVEIWGQQASEVDFGGSGNAYVPAFAALSLASDNVGNSFGFFAWLTGQPGESDLGSGDVGSGGLCNETEPPCPGLPTPDPLLQTQMPPGYSWVEIAVVSPGVSTNFDENGWDEKQLSGCPGTNRGSTCYRQAYHVYGRRDIPLTQPDGSKTIVFLRPTPRQPGDPTWPQTYVFEYPFVSPAAGSGSGAGCCPGGTPVGDLFNCETVTGTCWGVIIGGVFYGITAKDCDGNVVAGGE